MTRVLLGVSTLVLLAVAGTAAAFELTGDFVQGGLAVGRAEPGSTVRVDGTPVRVSADGRFLVGFGRDATGPVVVTATTAAGETARQEIAVASRDWDIQRIDGLPSRQVTPSPEDLARIRADSAAIRDVRTLNSPLEGFADGFIWPVTGPISGVFGSQRILNGEPRSPHRGVDVAAPEGTPIRAAAGGRVVLVHPDMYFTGQSLMIDHGHGLTSVYVHMSAMEVVEGEAVRQGDIIGRVGATGRATGPHLHWGVSLFGTHLDPRLLAGPMP